MPLVAKYALRGAFAPTWITRSINSLDYNVNSLTRSNNSFLVLYMIFFQDSDLISLLQLASPAVMLLLFLFSEC